MARSIDQSFYNSKTWRRTAAAYKKSVNGLCELCLKEGRREPGKIVHHVDELSDPSKIEGAEGAKRAYSFDNLMLVCEPHHNQIHFQKKPKRYRVDEDGRLIF